MYISDKETVSSICKKTNNKKKTTYQLNNKKTQGKEAKDLFRLFSNEDIQTMNKPVM